MSEVTDTELCRLCATNKENLVGIYDPEGQKLLIEDKIIKCLRIQVLYKYKKINKFLFNLKTLFIGFYYRLFAFRYMR